MPSVLFCFIFQVVSCIFAWGYLQTSILLTYSLLDNWNYGHEIPLLAYWLRWDLTNFLKSPGLSLKCDLVDHIPSSWDCRREPSSPACETFLHHDVYSTFYFFWIKYI
jgi:hypothetical protein